MISRLALPEIHALLQLSDLATLGAVVNQWYPTWPT
jgi:hypothetical protein